MNLSTGNEKLSPNKRPRLSREGKTVAVMIELYCKKNHQGISFCNECRELLEYALQRLDKCPFQEGKTTCAKCPVHCYKPDMREKVRKVMQFAGPRMFHRHPVLTLYHFLDGRRKEPLNP